jgi:pimeloyl-[acyl-carrier protein] methyl ester esterase
MELIFIHGWGFDASFWDELAAQLPQFRQKRIDLGFFGETANEVDDAIPSILVGHSLGFVHGMRSRKNWAGWVAINGFAHFVATPTQAGCVPESSLREMKEKMTKDPPRTLARFYSSIGATPPVTAAAPRIERLHEALDELLAIDLDGALRSMPGLALASRNDPLVPVAASEALAVPSARIQWHATGGHMLPQSAAPWCAEAIAGFVKETQFASKEKRVAIQHGLSPSPLGGGLGGGSAR